jgi:hypothetical protein
MKKESREVKCIKYLIKCRDGAYPSTHYHKKCCKNILDFMGAELYNSINPERVRLYYAAVAMIENNKGKL